jgi:hypothetical protein
MVYVGEYLGTGLGQSVLIHTGDEVHEYLLHFPVFVRDVVEGRDSHVGFMTRHIPQAYEQQRLA